MRAYIKAELLKNRHSEWARLMVIFLQYRFYVPYIFRLEMQHIIR